MASDAGYKFKETQHLLLTSCCHSDDDNGAIGSIPKPFSITTSKATASKAEAKTAGRMEGGCHPRTNCTAAMTLCMWWVRCQDPFDARGMLGSFKLWQHIQLSCCTKNTLCFGFPHPKCQFRFLCIITRSVTLTVEQNPQSSAKSLIFETMAHFSQNRLEGSEYSVTGVLMHRVPQPILGLKEHPTRLEHNDDRTQKGIVTGISDLRAQTQTSVGEQEAKCR